MSIYTRVLKKLIREHLSHISSELNNQSKSIGYSHKLSLDQKEIISLLEEKIVCFTASENDAKATEKFKEFLGIARTQVQQAREKHGKHPEKGSTIECLNNLIFRIDSFYDKLKSFSIVRPASTRASFDFLEMPERETPDYTVYFQLCYYFGDEIFKPSSGNDIAVRSQKEQKVIERLQELNELVTCVRPEHEFTQNKSRTLKVLKDLISDNKEVVHSAVSKLPMPSITLFSAVSVKSPAEWFAPGEGRLGAICKLAIREIDMLRSEHLVERKTTVSLSSDLVEEMSEHEEKQEESYSPH